MWEGDGLGLLMVEVGVMQWAGGLHPGAVSSEFETCWDMNLTRAWSRGWLVIRRWLIHGMSI